MTDPLKPETPSQIGSVVGVDRMDVIDRQKQDPRTKLELLAIEMKNVTGRDPRGGGHAFVARPRVILQMLIDMKVKNAFHDAIKLNDAVIVGTLNSDVVGWWQDVPIIVRCSVTNDNLHCLVRDKIPESTMLERRLAGQIRMAAHYDKLETLRAN